MPGLHQLPDPIEVERIASEWIARLQADDVSKEDRIRFEAWYGAHPLHARLYTELSRTWEQLTSAGPLVRAVSFAQSMTQAVPARVRRRHWLPAAALAAAITAAVAGWYFARSAPQTEFRTAIGERATIALPDGSTMELDSNSVARVRFTETSRVILLDSGEGFFQVRHDARRPFWVLGGGAWVRDVGTSFDVDLDTTGVQVTVSEGTVRAGALNARAGSNPPQETALVTVPIAVLTAGEQADIRTTDIAKRQLSAAQLARSETWREGIVSFDNQPLAEVLKQLGRYTPLTIHLQDEQLRRLPVGGTFQASPTGVETLLSMLERGFGLSIRREGDRVDIEKERRTPANE